MINQEMVDELIDFTSAETVRSFRSEPKKAYKYLLCGMLRDIFFYGNYIAPPSIFYGWARMMKDLRGVDFIDPSLGDLQHIEFSKRELTTSFFKNPSDVDAIIHFFRKILNDMKNKNNSLFSVDEINKIFNIENYFESQGTILKPHHWIDVNFYSGLTPTHPEFFNYMDVISLWNDSIEKFDRISNIDVQSREYKELNYSLSSSLRWLMIQAVTYVESYLYYYFYNVSHDQNLAPHLPKIKGYIQDTQIVEDIIFRLNPAIKTNTFLLEKYEQYKTAIKTRDRFVHTSAFQNKANQLSELAPLLEVSLDKTIECLENCFDFVDLIENLIPENEKLLYWKNRFEIPVFSQMKKISILNINN